MAYIEPLVMVYQEYASLSTSTETAQLPACIVGPCYQIVDADVDETLAFAGNYTETGLSKAAIPNVAAGAKIDVASLRFRFKNPLVRISDAITPASASVNEITCTASTFPENIAVGDIVKFSGQDGEWKVYSINAGNFSFLVNKEVPTVSAQLFIVFDNVDDDPGAVGEYMRLDGVVYHIVAAPSEGQYQVERATDQSISAFDVTGTGRLESRDPAGNTSFTVTRRVDEFICNIDENGCSADASSYKFDVIGVQAKVDDVEYPVVEAELYVGYRALRNDLSSIGVAYTVDEIIAALGKIDPRNPLAYGVNVAMANATNAGIYYVGVDSDDLEGYTAAKDRLENYGPLYAIVPLTQNVGILNLFKLHAEAMAAAEIGQWRIALGNTPLPTKEVLAASNTNEDLGDLHMGTIAKDGDGDLCWLKDAKATFRSSSCDAGDTLVIIHKAEDAETGDTVVKEYEFTVEQVPTDDIITVDQNADFADKEGFPFVEGDLVEYRVEHTLDHEGQAKAIAAASKAFGSRRFVHVWPDICVIDGNELPGYYLCCAVAGAISSLQPHYGMTRLSVAGIEAVKHSSDIFNRNQLNIIADGGTFIFAQDAPTAAPYIRHQLTSDRSAIEFQEVSFVKNFDYVCYILKDVLDEYIGKWNVTNATCRAIETSINSVLENLKGQIYPKIGSPVINYRDVRAIQSDLSKDRVEAFATVEFPYPLNTIAMHVISA